MSYDQDPADAKNQITQLQSALLAERRMKVLLIEDISMAIDMGNFTPSNEVGDELVALGLAEWVGCSCPQCPDCEPTLRIFDDKLAALKKECGL